MSTVFKIRLSYAVLLVGAFGLCLFFSELISVCALILLLSLPCLLFLQALFCLLSVKVNFENQTDFAQIDRPQTQIITLANTSIFPIYRIKLILTMQNKFSNQIKKDNIIFSLSSKESKNISIDFQGGHCGNYTFAVKKIVCYDGISLMSVSKRFKKSKLQKSIFVLPITDNAEIELPQIENISDSESSGYSKTQKGDDYSESFDYHSYQEGDKLKHIHWKLSNRLDKLMVKEGSLPISSKVCLLVDANSTDMNLLDDIFSSLFAMSQHLSQGEILHEIAFYCDYDECLRFVLIENESDLIFALTGIFETAISTDNRSLAYFNEMEKEVENNKKYSNIFYYSASGYSNSTLHSLF